MEHSTGALYLQDNERSSDGQLFVVDTKGWTLGERMLRPGNEGLQLCLLQGLTGMLGSCDPYVTVYRAVQEVEQEESARAAAENKEPTSAACYFYNNSSSSRQHYNAARVSEVAAVFVSEDGAPPATRHRVVYPANPSAHTRTISYLDPNCHP